MNIAYQFGEKLRYFNNTSIINSVFRTFFFIFITIYGVCPSITLTPSVGYADARS